VSKLKGKGPATTINKPSSKNLENASGTNTSSKLTATITAVPAAGTDTNQEDSRSGNFEDDADNDYLSQAVIDLVQDFVGHDITHLSGRQIKNLAKAMPTTQASALETQAESASVSLFVYLFNQLLLTHWQTITQPFAGVGLASGDRNGSPSREGNVWFILSTLPN
jgi:hypothetical protein